MDDMNWYQDGWNVGYIHAEGRIPIDPRWSMADAAKAGQLDEFMRGFNDGYAKAEQDQAGS